MSWASSFWSHNRNFLGNAVKNVSPVAAMFIPGIGPLAAAAIAGGGSALGQAMEKGSNIGDIAKTGLSNAALAEAGRPLAQYGMGAVRGAFVPSSSVATTAAPSAAGAETGGASGFGSATPHFPGLGGPAAAPVAASESAPGMLSRTGSFLESHPTAVAMGLQGAGNIASGIAGQKRSQAEADLLDYELQRTKARDAALEPLRQAFAGQLKNMLSGQNPFAYHPYTG